MWFTVCQGDEIFSESIAAFVGSQHRGDGGENRFDAVQVAWGLRSVRDAYRAPKALRTPPVDLLRVSANLL